MKSYSNDTPSPSINGDEISGVEDEEDLIYVGDADEILDDEEDDIDEPMEPPNDDSCLIFDKHVGSVFCGDIHPSGSIAVTGGEDDKAFVWEIKSGNIVMECTGHKDSVIFVGFSHDGSYLATADMCGVIKIWKCNLDTEKLDKWPCIFEYEAGDLTWGLWHFGTRVLICGATSGEIYIFKIPSGDTKVIQSHNSRVECGKILPDGRRLAAGYEDGSIKVWDLKSETVLQHIETDMHPSGVTALDVHPGNNLIASVSTEGKIGLIATSTGKVVGQIDTASELESVAFSKDPEFGLFAVGSLDGEVSIWDVSKQMLRHQCSKKGDKSGSVGVTKITWSKNNLISGCLDGAIRIYDGRSGELECKLTGHLSEILDFTHNSQEKIILTTSDDGTARIFKCEPKIENK